MYPYIQKNYINTIARFVMLSAVFVAHLSGHLYKHIIKIQGTFSSQMSVPGSSSSTGKSLMQTVNMLIFYGEPQPSTTNATESTFYETLHDGTPFFGKFLLHTYIQKKFVRKYWFIVAK